METQNWLSYEKNMVLYHRTNFPDSSVYHWSEIPEDYLYQSGYIMTYNAHRTHRLLIKNGKLTDYGLDGLSKDINGHYHGLQMKCYTDNSVSANDIGTFLSVMMNRLIKKDTESKGYLYTTTNLTTELKDDIDNGQMILWKCVSFENLPILEEKTEDNEETNIELRSYQIEAIDALNNFDEDGLKVLSMFCAGGKTLICANHLKTIDKRIVLFIAPLKISVNNLRTRCKKFINERLEILVDSDCGGNTDIKEIKEQLTESKTDNEKLAVYTTYSSAGNILKNIYEKNPELYEQTYVIVDETHNLIGRDILCEFINLIGNGLLMSATIPQELYETFDCSVTYEYDMKTAIQNKYMVDYTVHLPYMNTEYNINKTFIDSDVPKNIITKDNIETLNQILFLMKGMLRYGSRRCIVYLPNREDCDKFNELFKIVGEKYHGLDIWVRKIDLGTTLNTRRTIIREFQEDNQNKNIELKIISCVRILDEAVDIPRCDSIFIGNCK